MVRAPAKRASYATRPRTSRVLAPSACPTRPALKFFGVASGACSDAGGSSTQVFFTWVLGGCVFWIGFVVRSCYHFGW